MATSGKRNVVSSLIVLHDELERMIDGYSHSPSGGTPHASGHCWRPNADVFIIKGEVVVRFELAGVSSEMIKVSYRDGALTIRGTRFDSAEEPKQRYWQMEIAHGSFERTVVIPTKIDPDKITANCKEGVLEVRLPAANRDHDTREVRIISDE